MVCLGSSTDSALGSAPDGLNTTSLATAKQIHSDRVLLVESPGPQGEGDALISNRAGHRPGNPNRRLSPHPDRRPQKSGGGCDSRRMARRGV